MRPSNHQLKPFEQHLQYTICHQDLTGSSLTFKRKHQSVHQMVHVSVFVWRHVFSFFPAEFSSITWTLYL